MKKSKSNRDLELLYEIGCLRFVDRTWKQFYNPNFQNLAEHHLRVAWIALLLAKKEGVKNTDKVLKLALLHDVAESRTGDVNYIQRQYVVRNEDLGVKDIFARTSIYDEFFSLWEEYKEMKSKEAQIVKDADSIDVDMELQEQESMGNPLKKEWKESRQFVFKNKLFSKTAKKLWKEIQVSNPHDWHRKSRNRLTSGDWSVKKTNPYRIKRIAKAEIVPAK